MDGSDQASGLAMQEPLPAGIPMVRTIAMPADTNPSGDIFGGWLMCQMDIAAGTAAARLCKGRCATICVETIRFHAPVKVGDEVGVWAELIAIGRTSMRFKVSAWRRAHDSDLAVKVTDAVFVFVALDAAGKPRVIAKSQVAGGVRSAAPGSPG